MNAIIIEDEKPAARRLNRMLDKLEVPIVAVLHSVEESIVWFKNNVHPDIIFLDIQLSDGLSFEIFDNVKINSAVIFTTAYDEYALQAFKLNSIDYLLKPIDDEELKAAVDKYQELLKTMNSKQINSNLQFNFEDIKKLLVNPVEREYKKRFTVKVGQHIKMIPLDEVECIYSENKGTYIHTSEGRNYLLETTLEGLEEQLPPDQFFRVSRKVFVQLNAIKDIIAYSNSRLKIITNCFRDFEIIVARERVKDFKTWLG